VTATDEAMQITTLVRQTRIKNAKFPKVCMSW